MLGRDVVAVGARGRRGRSRRRATSSGHQSARFGGTWMPTSGSSSRAAAIELAHLVDRHLRAQAQSGSGSLAAAARSRCASTPRPRRSRDLRRLLAVVAAVGHEVLEDQLLDVAVLAVQRGERLERRDAVLGALADADEDAARERDAQLAGGADRLQAQRRILRRRARVRRRIRRSETTRASGPARRSPRAAARGPRASSAPRLVCGSRPRSSASLAHPDHVADEVLEAELGQAAPRPRVDSRVVAGQDQQLLDVACAHARSSSASTSSGLVQVRAVRRERAVLAVHAGARERQRQVARERDASHQGRSTNVRSVRGSPICSSGATRARGPRQAPLCSPFMETTTPASGIFLARHGRTAYNEEHRFQGHLPVPLDALGLQQAHELAERASAYGFEVALREHPVPRRPDSGARRRAPAPQADPRRPARRDRRRRLDRPPLLGRARRITRALRHVRGRRPGLRLSRAASRLPNRTFASPPPSAKSKKARRRPSSSATAWSSAPRCTRASGVPRSPGAPRTARSSRSTLRPSAWARGPLSPRKRLAARRWVQCEVHELAAAREQTRDEPVSPSRAMRERGTTSSMPDASAPSRAALSTCE